LHKSPFTADQNEWYFQEKIQKIIQIQHNKAPVGDFRVADAQNQEH